MRKPKQRDGSPRRKKPPPPPPPEAFSTHATGGAARCSSSSDSTVEALANARERLERDAVDILMRQKKELEAECERLRREVDRAAESFKLAWQSERAAHQHDLEGAALARKAAEEEARALRESVSAARDALDRRSATAQAEVEELRAAVERSQPQNERMRREGSGQLRALQRQVAQLRAEKGELCEDFTAKLAAITGHGMPPVAGADGSATTASSSGGAGGGTPLLPAKLAGYEGLSIYSDASGTAAVQLQSVMMAASGASMSSSGGYGSSCSSSGGSLGGMIVSSGGSLSSNSISGGSTSGGCGGIGLLLTSSGADAASDQKRAIDTMKVAQQLRTAEADLEKALRQLALKTRRVGELEQLVENHRLEQLKKDSELATRANELAKLTVHTNSERARADRLQQEVTRLHEALATRSDEMTTLQQETMRLLAHLETLELVGGHAEADVTRIGAPRPLPTSTWRPPAHPPGLMHASQHKRMAPVPAQQHAASLGGVWVSATAGDPSGGGATARSDASTLSGGEWPDELAELLTSEGGAG